MRFEQRADARRIGQADDLFEHGNQRTQRVFAEDRAFGDGRDIFVFRNGHGESVAAVDVQHDVNVGAAVAHVDDTVGTDLKSRLQFIERRDLAVARRNADDGFDLAGLRMIMEARAEDVVRRYDVFQRRLDHLFRRRRNDEKRKVITFDSIAQYFRQQMDVLLEPDSLTGFDQMLFANAAEFGVVQQQIGELAPLLRKVDPRHSRNPLFKTRYAEHLAQNETGIVETQCLIEITCKQIMLHSSPSPLNSLAPPAARGAAGKNPSRHDMAPSLNPLSINPMINLIDPQLRRRSLKQ